METEDRILEEIRNDPEVQPRMGEWLRLQELKENPGWLYLSERLKFFGENTMKRLARRLLSGDKIDPEEIAFQRGFIKAVEFITAYPERFEKDLERAAEQAYVRAQERLSEEIGEEPYR